MGIQRKHDVKEFVIYGSRGLSLKLLGKINQFLYTSLILFLGFMMLFSIVIGMLELPHVLLLYVFFVWIGLLLVMVGFTIYVKKVTIPIGILAIDSTNLQKHIGDYKRKVSISQIESITTKNHLKGWLFINSNKTLLVTINIDTQECIKFVINNISSTRPQTRFEELIKTLPAPNR